MEKCLVALDIGAGTGSKIGFYTLQRDLISSALLGFADYCDDFDEYVELLSEKISSTCPTNHEIVAIGISAAGILSLDGSFLLFANCSRYNGHNLKEGLENKFKLPVAIDNDANTGALAEWSIVQTELLYWVFGGGWGGAWVSKEGEILHPSHDWDGNDHSLHYTNEPGYSVPLSKDKLRLLFLEVGASYEQFENNLLDDNSLPPDITVGPAGDATTLRAEVILSGPGRCRLFRALVGDDTFYERFLDIHEVAQMNDPSIAGQHISKLSNMRVESAINTDRLYGKILACAAKTIFQDGKSYGLRDDVPICLGGKPSYALPYFGPSCQRQMGRMGIMSYMRPSILDERNMNTNLVGASVLADRAFKEGRRVRID